MVHVPLMFLSEWSDFFQSLALQERKIDDSSGLHVVETARVADMLPVSLCKKKRLAIRHMNRLLFPKTLSIPSYDIGKYVGLRTHQYPLVTHILRLCLFNLWYPACNEPCAILLSVACPATRRF